MTATSHLPMTEQCLLALFILGGEASTSQVRQWLETEGEHVTATHAVWQTLRYLAHKKVPLVEVAQAGARSTPTLWRITEHGAAILAEDDEPARVPCGLGWPA